MEDYLPEEIRTPPVTLVSIVGNQELHSTISTHLHSEQPPINTLALPDFTKISVIDRKPKENDNQLPSAYTCTGILKRDWLLKHRTQQWIIRLGSNSTMDSTLGFDDVRLGFKVSKRLMWMFLVIAVIGLMVGTFLMVAVNGQLMLNLEVPLMASLSRSPG